MFMASSSKWIWIVGGSVLPLVGNDYMSFSCGLFARETPMKSTILARRVFFVYFYLSNYFVDFENNTNFAGETVLKTYFTMMRV